jgi:hypothetical protein
VDDRAAPVSRQGSRQGDKETGQSEII